MVNIGHSKVENHSKNLPRPTSEQILAELETVRINLPKTPNNGQSVVFEQIEKQLDLDSFSQDKV